MSRLTRRQAIKVLGTSAVAAAAGIDAYAGTYDPKPEPAHNTEERKMKVLLINGSPHAKGNTSRLLEEAASQLNRHGIDTETVHIGTRPVRGCIACGKCFELRKCAFDDDVCNAFLEKMGESDALIVGSPVYYGIPAGPVLSLLQRMMFSCTEKFSGKPAAAVTVCRRGGATSAFQTLQMPFQMINMPIVTSQYWNIGYGGAPGEVSEDAEGLQTMRTLADNMAYMLKQFSSGTAQRPEREKGIYTNFIR